MYYIYPIYFAESTLKPLRLSQTLKFLFNAITSKMKSSVACLAFDLQHIYHIYTFNPLQVKQQIVKIRKKLLIYYHLQIWTATGLETNVVE